MVQTLNDVCFEVETPVVSLLNPLERAQWRGFVTTENRIDKNNREVRSAKHAFSTDKSALIHSSGKQLAAKRPGVDEELLPAITGPNLPLISQSAALRNCTGLDDVFIYPTSTLLLRERSETFLGLSVVVLRFRQAERGEGEPTRRSGSSSMARFTAELRISVSNHHRWRSVVSFGLSFTPIQCRRRHSSVRSSCLAAAGYAGPHVSTNDCAARRSRYTQSDSFQGSSNRLRIAPTPL